MLLDSLLFSLNVTLPTIFMLLLGVWLKQRKVVDDNFANTASKLVFNFALPPMLFLNVARSQPDYLGQINLVLIGVLGTFFTFLVAEWWAARYIQTRAYRGIFVQATFRSNLAILGLAMTTNAYGTEAIAAVSVYTAALVILFNVLGVITLSRSLSEKKPNIANLIYEMIKNPLILAIFIGMIVSHFNLFQQIPTAILKTSDYLAHIALPLALICAGISLNFKQFGKLQQNISEDNEARNIVFLASFIRLIVAPTIMFIIGKWGLSLSPMALGILFLTNATPVASATYAMVRHYGGNATIAANIIALTTIASIFVSSFGLVILRHFAWI